MDSAFPAGFGESAHEGACGAGGTRPIQINTRRHRPRQLPLPGTAADGPPLSMTAVAGNPPPLGPLPESSNSGDPAPSQLRSFARPAPPLPPRFLFTPLSTQPLL